MTERVIEFSLIPDPRTLFRKEFAGHGSGKFLVLRYELKSIARPFLLSLLVLLAPAQAAHVTVETTRNGDALEVEASAEFEGSLARSWQVLTDYNRLAEFVPDLHVSRVISREGSSAVVEQRGEARLLFFSYPMDVRLAVTEFPHERIVSQATAGNFREMRCTYTLEMREGRVLLRYSGRLVPDFYIPPLIGTLVLRSHVKSTFRALVEEIERQHRGAEKP